MSCHNPNSVEFKNKLKSQPNPILASIELDMEANISLSDDLSLEEYYLAYRDLYELGSYEDYVDYRQKSKDKFVIGSKDDVSLFEQYLEQKDWDSNSNFNIKCL